MLYQPSDVEIGCARGEVCSYKIENDVRRLERAVKLLKPLKLFFDVDVWWCESQASDQSYALSVCKVSNSVYDCTCPDRLFNADKPCKHMVAFTTYKFIMEHHLCYRMEIDCDAEFLEPELHLFHDFKESVCYVRPTGLPNYMWAFDAPDDMAKFSRWLAGNPSLCLAWQVEIDIHF